MSIRTGLLVLFSFVAACDSQTESSKPEVADAEATPPTPDAKTPDAETPGSEALGAKTRGAKTPEAKTLDAKTPDAKAPEAKPLDTPNPIAADPTKSEPAFTIALRSDVHIMPTRTTDGTLLFHAAGKLARVDSGALVEVPAAGPIKAMYDRDIFLDHFGGRWPDAIFTCWMGGLPNNPGRPLLLRFEPGKGWKKRGNGSGNNKWCYEGFAASNSGALLSRKAAHDYLEEQFAFGPFVTDKVRPGFAVIEGTADVSNPKLPLVADWALGKDDEIWAVTGPELIRLPPGKPHETFALPEPVARRSSEPLRVTYADDTVYVHGASRDGPYLARWKDGALESVELPEALTREHAPDVYVPPVHIADVQVAHNGDLWILSGRILWPEVADGALWHQANDGWEHIEPSVPDQIDPDADRRFAEHESIDGFSLDGDDLWVSLRSFRYGRGSDCLVLTTKSVATEVVWSFFP